MGPPEGAQILKKSHATRASQRGVAFFVDKFYNFHKLLT